MKHLPLLFILLFSGIGFAQNGTAKGKDLRITSLIEGTLLLPETAKQPPLAILIGGSGPIDRDGNQLMSKSNSLKYLAEGLFDAGIASFRYDKRIVRLMKQGTVDERTISLDDFVDDLRAVIDHFTKREPFEKIVLIGHSQGSLVGMLAVNEQVDGFVSLAGAGQAIDDVIVDQLAKQAPGLRENARQSFDDMRANGIALNYSPGLSSIFRASLQPFLLSWMQYDPGQVIASIDIPALIINGDKDLQVQLSEADKLHQARPGSRKVIVENMNHVLKEIQGDDIENSKSYNEPQRPLHPQLVPLITAFILEL